MFFECVDSKSRQSILTNPENVLFVVGVMGQHRFSTFDLIV